jgi:endonuclease YncB( thermonuclease family)
MLGALGRSAFGLNCILLACTAFVQAQDAAPADFVPSTPPDLSAHTPVTVAQVLTGNQLIVQLDGAPTTVRLLGAFVPATESAVAQAFTTHLLLGERVWLLPEPDWPERDEEDRRWRHVYRVPDGLYVNLELVRQGYARVSAAAPFAHQQAFRAAERVARRARKGLWTSPSEERGQPDADSPLADSDVKAPADPAPAAGPATRPAASPVRAAAPAPPASDTNTVYITEHGRKYHRADCQYARNGGRPVSPADARARGLTPCARCHPPP